ncbi:MAG: circadian clock protein KaiB [Desulfobacterales bacterium]|nr:circadian clock protein KaiB [Desulfobacterales bacterium]
MSNSDVTVHNSYNQKKYIMKLFLAGNEPKSQLAKKNLIKICESYIKEMYYIEVVDVLKDFQAALKNDVFVTPTLIISNPIPEKVIIGSLSDTQKVIDALGIDIFDKAL